MLFTNFREAWANIQILLHPPQVAGRGDADGGNDIKRRAGIDLAMQIFVTLFCFGLGTYLFIWGESESREKFGAGLIGTGIGFWLK